MAISETGIALASPSAPASRATGSGSGVKPHGFADGDPNSFASLVNGLADAGQSADQPALGAAGQPQQPRGEQHSHVDRGRLKSAPSDPAGAVRIGQQTDGASEAVEVEATKTGSRGQRRLKEAVADSGSVFLQSTVADGGGYPAMPTLPQSVSSDVQTDANVPPAEASGPSTLTATPTAQPTPTFASSRPTLTATARPETALSAMAVAASTGLVSKTEPAPAFESGADTLGVTNEAAHVVQRTWLDSPSGLTTSATDGLRPIERSLTITDVPAASTQRDTPQPPDNQARSVGLSAVRDALARTAETLPDVDVVDPGSVRRDARSGATATATPAAFSRPSVFAFSGVELRSVVDQAAARQGSAANAPPDPVSPPNDHLLQGPGPEGGESLAKLAATPTAASRSREDDAIGESFDAVQIESTPIRDESVPSGASGERPLVAPLSWVPTTIGNDRDARVAVLSAQTRLRVDSALKEAPPARYPESKAPAPAPSSLSARTHGESGTTFVGGSSHTADIVTPVGAKTASGIKAGQSVSRPVARDTESSSRTLQQSLDSRSDARELHLADPNDVATADAAGSSIQIIPPPQPVAVPVRDVTRVPVSRRPPDAALAPSATVMLVAPLTERTERTIEGQATTTRSDTSSSDTLNTVHVGSARGTHQPAGPSSQSAIELSPLDQLAVERLGMVTATVASNPTPSRRPDTVTAAPPRPTGTAAIAIAAFQAAAAAAPDAQRSTTVSAANALPTALLDAQLPTQIVHAIRVQADNGDGHVRLRLNPDFLGDLSVDVRVNAGSVVASVQASSADVREWLRTNEAMLRQTLAEQGLHLERFVVVEEDAKPGKDQPEQRRDDASDQQQAWQRRPRRPRNTGTFEIIL